MRFVVFVVVFYTEDEKINEWMKNIKKFKIINFEYRYYFFHFVRFLNQTPTNLLIQKVNLFEF